MAAEVGELAFDVLVDVIIDIAEEVGSESEIVAELTTVQESIGDSVTSDINYFETTNGDTPDVATSKALNNAANTIAPISQDAADAWIEGMQEEGYTFESGNEAENADFEDTDPDSNPDKGDSDTPECQANPESAECLAQKQSKLSKFFDFMAKWGGPIGGAIAAAATVVYIFIGQVARWICQAIQKIKGTCATSPQGEASCIDQACNSKLCDGAKSFVSFIRKYWIEISIALGSVGVAVTWYFKSVAPLILSGICLLVVVALKSVLGNLAATVVCDVGASNCLFQGKPINC
jgi:hypothetical protein